MPFDEVDRVPQSHLRPDHLEVGLRRGFEVPAPGTRRFAARARPRHRRDVPLPRRKLGDVRTLPDGRGAEDEDETRLAITARLLSAATGISYESAIERIEIEAEGRGG